MTTKEGRIECPESVESVFFSRDGKKLLVVGGTQLGTYMGPSNLYIWDIEREVEEKRIGLGGYVPVKASNSVKLIRLQTTVEVKDVATGETRDHKPASLIAPGLTLALSPDGDLAVRVSSEPLIKVFDIQHDIELAPYKFPPRSIVSCASFSPNGKLLCACGPYEYEAGNKPRSVIVLWHLGESEPVWSWNDMENNLVSFDISPDGSTVASCSNGLGSDDSGELILRDARNGKEVVRRSENAGGYHTVRFSPDGKLLASGGFSLTKASGTSAIWSANDLKPQFTLDGKQGIVTDVRFSPDGKMVATASVDGTVLLWDSATGKRLVAGQEKRARVKARE